tara:strand:+ start:65 stop:298 length:234 start_codon:yes stop_codon:yes gene_type:complete
MKQLTFEEWEEKTDRIREIYESGEIEECDIRERIAHDCKERMTIGWDRKTFSDIYCDIQWELAKEKAEEEYYKGDIK